MPSLQNCNVGCNLHVVVSVECFVADSARELCWTNKDLCRRRNPVLAFERSNHVIRVSRVGPRSNWRTNVKGYCYTTLTRRFLVTHRVAWGGNIIDGALRDVLARRPKRKKNGIIIFFISFQTGTLSTRGYVSKGGSLHGDFDAVIWRVGEREKARERERQRDGFGGEDKRGTRKAINKQMLWAILSLGMLK
jgi:hypothetical protein